MRRGINWLIDRRITILYFQVEGNVVRRAIAAFSSSHPVESRYESPQRYPQTSLCDHAGRIALGAGEGILARSSVGKRGEGYSGRRSPEAPLGRGQARRPGICIVGARFG